MSNDEHDLVDLAATLAAAKQREEQAKGERIAAEEAIIAATGFRKPDGQETYLGESKNGVCKLVLKQPVSTNVDDEAWVKLRRTLEAKHPARAVFKAKYSVDAKKARALQAENKKAWADVSAVVTRKPGKISVSVDELIMRLPLIDPTKRVGVLGPFEDEALRRYGNAIGEGEPRPEEV